MDQQRCYVYRQSKERAAKRQKIEPQGVNVSFDLRKRTYSTAWGQQEEQFDSLIHSLNAPILQEIGDFVCADHVQQPHTALPTALIATGSSGASNDVLFEQLRSAILARQTSLFVSLNASEAPNFKSLLKNLIQKATNETSGYDDEDGEQPDATSRRKLLNYDLEILYDWCEARSRHSVVISFQDTEAFDAALLTDTLALLKSWQGRIDFKLVFGIATSLDLFQDRLPKTALRCIKGRLFNIPKPEDALEAIFQESVTAEKSVVRLGPTLVADFMQRQHDHIQSVHDFKQALKYAYMTHFFADPLSIFLCSELTLEQTIPEHFEAVRNTPSFRVHVDRLVQAGNVAEARSLLNSDEALFKGIKSALLIGQRQTVWTMGACSIIKTVRSTIPNKEAVPFSALYTRALSGTLQTSSLLRETLLFSKRASPLILLDLLTKVADTLIVMPPSAVDVSPDDFNDLHEELSELLETYNGKAPLHIPDESTPRAGGPKKKPAPSTAQLQYSDILSRYHNLLADFFSKALTPLAAIFLGEILFYDLKSPHRDVFTPKPRVAIERALSAPQDYLGCECCTHALCSTQPATSLLYQLYLESGALINTFDMWSAFKAMVGEQQPDERMAMALFFQGLAELKHMGMLKQSRKRTDCLAKVLWKGI